MAPWEDLGEIALPGTMQFGCTPGRRANQYSVMTRVVDTETVVAVHDSFAEFVAENPLAAGSNFIVETFGVQGVDALPDDYSAFPHRGFFNNAVVFAMTYTDDAVAEAADAWALGWRNTFADPAISGYPEWHMYQNYAHDDEPLSALYGEAAWRHERLTALKQTYDPNGNFDGFHAVPRNLADWN
jgi:fumiquinazoline A oxidase